MLFHRRFRYTASEPTVFTHAIDPLSMIIAASDIDEIILRFRRILDISRTSTTMACRNSHKWIYEMS